jgi:spermidine synthase
LNKGLIQKFIWIELMLGVVGGYSSAALMWAFAFTEGFQIVLYVLVTVMGVLVGLEIPLLMPS